MKTYDWVKRAETAEARVRELEDFLAATDAKLAEERTDFDYVVKRAERAEAKLHELSVKYTVALDELRKFKNE